MMWQSLQNPPWGKTDRGVKKGNLIVKKNLLLTRILTPLLPTLFPSQSLFRDISTRVQMAEKASTGERQQKPVKWNILHYHQGFPGRLKSSALPSFRGSAQLQRVFPWESVHTCKCAHAQTSACIHTAKRRRNKKKGGGEETRFGMSVSVLYSHIILFYVPPPWQGRGRLEQQSECDVTLCWGLYSARLLLICKLT